MKQQKKQEEGKKFWQKVKSLFTPDTRIDEEEDVQIMIDEHTELQVKGVALAKTSGTQSGTDYIVAYARNSTPVKCINYITLMKGSSFVGHNSCEVA